MAKLFVVLSFYFLGVLYGVTEAKQELGQNRLELLSGIKRSKDEKSFWDEKFSNNNYLFGKAPAKFLAQNYQFISSGSTVLDVGMGEGRNAVFMAQKGYKVTGIDISSVAVKKARALAHEYGVRIESIVTPVEKFLPEKPFDAILCFYYVDRKLIPKMLNWLKPGGIIIFESHSEKQKGMKGYESYNIEYLLKQGELLNLFKGTQILKFEEPLHHQEFTSSIIVKK